MKHREASQFVGDIPHHYDHGLGPNIFEDYAADLALRACAHEPHHVLELAAGTGIVSRKLRDALPGAAHIIISDLNIPMLDVAREKFGKHENVDFATVDAMELDFPNHCFDLLVCQFGVMFFPDKQASFREARRVLRHDGAYIFNTWGPIEENPFAQMAHETCAEFFPDDPPGFYRVPFSYADPDEVAADLKAAGFTQVEATPVARINQIHDLTAFARGIVYGNPLIDEINRRGGVHADKVTEEIERRFRDAWGPDPANMPLMATVFACRV